MSSVNNKCRDHRPGRLCFLFPVMCKLQQHRPWKSDFEFCSSPLLLSSLISPLLAPSQASLWRCSNPGSRSKAKKLRGRQCWGRVANVFWWSTDWSTLAHQSNSYSMRICFHRVWPQFHPWCLRLWISGLFLFWPQATRSHWKLSWML